MIDHCLLELKKNGHKANLLNGQILKKLFIELASKTP